MIPVEIPSNVRSPSVIKETLNRIGIACHETRTLRPSIYLYTDKDGRHFLIHFKEYFLITRPNAYNNVSKDDMDRLAYVARLLAQWKLIEVDSVHLKNSNFVSVEVVPKAEIRNWKIKHLIKF